MTARWRFVLVALFVLAGSAWAGTVLRRLHAVRLREATLVAMLPPVAHAAPADARPRVRAAAASAGVTVVGLARSGRVALVGSEAAMRVLLVDLEGGDPAVRFADWRLQPVPGTADRVRFDGVALLWADAR